VSKLWDFHTAIEQVASCDFECEGGPLANNVAWRWLQKSWPKYLVGQTVEFEVEGELGGQKLKRWQKYTVVGCSLSADCERQTFIYSLSNDPPQPWHYGSGPQFRDVAERKLRLPVPEQVLA